jgi:hypothetical protein
MVAAHKACRNAGQACTQCEKNQQPAPREFNLKKAHQKQKDRRGNPAGDDYPGQRGKRTPKL